MTARQKYEAIVVYAFFGVIGIIAFGVISIFLKEHFK